MPKARERFSKKSVLEEVKALRDKIRLYSNMSLFELRKEYERLGYRAIEPMSREEIMKQLHIQATYHLTNVLDLE